MRLLMNRFLTLCFCLFLVSCSNTKIIEKTYMPEIPSVMLEDCEKLGKLDRNLNTKENVYIIIDNYQKYKMCKQKIKTLREWYAEQRRIYETEGR